MPNFLKKPPKNKVNTEIKFIANITEGSENSVISDLKFIAENLTAEEINIVRKVAANTVIKTMALDYASRYI